MRKIPFKRNMHLTNMFNLPKRMFPWLPGCAVLVIPSSWLQAAPVKLPWTTATAQPVTPASPFLSGSGHCYEAHSLSHILLRQQSLCRQPPLGQGPQPAPAEGKQWESQQRLHLSSQPLPRARVTTWAQGSHWLCITVSCLIFSLHITI